MKKTNLLAIFVILAMLTPTASHAALTMATRLDASQFTSAGTIGTWEDSSFYTDSDHDATASGATQPTVVLGGLNGLPVVRFDGTDDFMTIAHTYTTGTAFIVAKYDTLGANDAQFDWFDGLYGSATDNGSAGQYWTGNNGAATWSNEAGGGFYNSKYLDGTLTNTALTSPDAFHLYGGVDSTPNSFTSWSLGRDRGIGGRTWQGDIAEVIIYEDTLSDFDRRGVEMYLNDKWGLGITPYEAGTFNANYAGLLLVVPEPSSTALLGLGGLALALRRRR